MTRILLRLFGKNMENPQNPAVRRSIGRFSGMVGLGCNMLLFTGKMLAEPWHPSGNPL